MNDPYVVMIAFAVLLFLLSFVPSSAMDFFDRFDWLERRRQRKERQEG